MADFQVPVVIEFMLERVTNIAMGAEIDNIVEFEELAKCAADAPTAFLSGARSAGQQDVEPEELIASQA